MNLADGVYSALNTEKAYDLDIRSFKDKTTATLTKAIEQAVEGTQSIVVRAYPDKLVMSKDQYDLLSGKPQFFQIGDVGQEFWLYRTKRNIMEVIVKD